MRLHAIARTCSNSLLTPKGLERVCGADRQLMLKKCFASLTRSIQQSQHEITLTVIDDHSDAEFLEFLRTTAQDLDWQLIQMTERGPNASALAQFKAAAESEALVYMVEDDYLHEPRAIDYMIGSYVHFVKLFNSDTVIYPYDCSLRYQPGSAAECSLYHDGVRYWRSVDKTANTMLTHYSTVQKHWPVFEDLAKNYPQVLEDDTINTLYHSVARPSAPIRAFSPIPSVAYHLGYGTPTQIAVGHTCWQDLWHNIPSWSLIQGWFYCPEFYQHVVNQLPQDAAIVEIGTWRGRSTCFLAECIKRSGKSVKFWAVDTFEGSNEAAHKETISGMATDLYTDFVANLKMCQVDDVVTPLRSTSTAASQQFQDQFLDFVMIDGSHDYESVRADIQTWLPKIKSGGIMAGDDYGGSWQGVTQAVDEHFGSQVMTVGSVWYVQV